MTFIFRYGSKLDGYSVPEGTEYLVSTPVLEDGVVRTAIEHRRVSGEEYGFGSTESFRRIEEAEKK